MFKGTLATSILLFVFHFQPLSAAELRFAVRDAEGRRLPSRVHLRDSEGKPVKSLGYPFWKDHFVCDGQARLELPPGAYAWEIERGPEYETSQGRITLNENSSHQVKTILHRIAKLRDEGWYSGDLHVHRPVTQIEALMSAEDLDFAPVIEWWNTPSKNARPLRQLDFPFGDGRIYQRMAGEDEREGGALLFFGLRKPLDLSVRSREFPSPMTFVTQARLQMPSVWIDIEKPFWWDVPTWLASGQVNSIGIANNHMNRSGMLANEAWGRARNEERLPSPRGNGYWTQEIYYHILNSGIRLPPSAGSASGVLNNPVGYNRVYVQLGDSDLTSDRWFDALRRGNSFVTNGPLLRVKANGQWPGASLEMSEKPLRIELEIRLDSNDPVSEVEVIVNGSVRKRIPLAGQQDQPVRATLELEEPGWMLVRVIAEVNETFRFASTAPWYIESAGTRPRISRRSAAFFSDWVEERIGRVESEIQDEKQREAVLRWHLRAREFWKDKLESATSE